MTSRQVRSALLIAVCAAVAGPVSSASAAGPMVGGGSFAQTVPFIDGTLYAFECHVAAPGAVSTTVSSCDLRGPTYSAAGAPATTSNGPVTTTHQAVSTRVQPYHLCWTVSARYSDGTTQTKSGCTNTSSVAGAGAG
jgi:hypothetical protein